MTPRPGLIVSRPLKITFVLGLLTALIVGAIKTVTAVGSAAGRPEIADFHAFMLAGDLAWHGHLANAYHTADMLALERRLGGQDIFMPWSYPPLFGLMLAPLSQIPLGAAFLLFGLTTLSLYVAALIWLDAETAWLALLAMAPTIIINLRIGQNGLLTGALFALAAASLLRAKPRCAGAAIGALAFKPHLAILWPVLLALQRRWAAFAVAAATVLTLTIVSFLIVGPKVVLAFMGAGPELTRAMAAGVYPLPRMTSLYACVRSLGVSANMALAVHALTAAGALAATFQVGRSLNARAQIGLTIMASLFISPYLYDYDQTIFGVGLALILPTLAERLSPWRQGVMLGGVALAQIIGVPINVSAVRISVGGPLILAAFIGVLFSLHDKHAGVRPANVAAEPVTP